MTPPAEVRRAVCREDVLTREEGRDLLVFDPDTGAIHTLNEAARFLWDRCDARPTLAELSSTLAAAYGLDGAAAASDTAAFVERAIALGLLRLENA